jgi:tryptophanyl-tRNA synthetase
VPDAMTDAMTDAIPDATDHPERPDRSDQSRPRPRILTGDTPTGRLHIGHWVGSLENRVRLQDDHDCYFLIANLHAFTTRAEQPGAIRRDTLDIVKDWLAAGVDPERATLVVQSEIPAIAELTWYFAMLLPVNRVLRNPTLRAELEAKDLGDAYSFGFPLYTVGQCADILAFRAQLVPVGADQAAHVEMCREVARRFDHVYCGVDPTTPDGDYERAGGVFPVPEALLGRVGRLVGIDGVRKMSKSMDNAIYLSDSTAEIRAKVARLHTGRQAMTDPGDIHNALFQYVRAFLLDPVRIRTLEDRYARGDSIGDGSIKAEVAAAIDALLAPMRERRAAYDGPRGDAQVLELLRAHTVRANTIANETRARARDAMQLDLGRGP